MARRRLATLIVIAAITAIVALGAFRDRSPAPSAQVLTLVTGSPRRIADGRAQIWLSRVRRADADTSVAATDVAEVELVAAGQTERLVAVPDRESDEVFGCRVRLLETLDTHPPAARLVVTVSRDYVPRIQSAAQTAVDAAGRPVRRRRGTRRR